MDRRAWIALTLAGLAAGFALGGGSPADAPTAPAAGGPSGMRGPLGDGAPRPALGPAPCPAGSLEHDGVCLPVATAPARTVRPGERELVPRRPDLPAALSAYALPVPAAEPVPGLPCPAALEPALALPAPRGGRLVEFPLAGQAERGPLVQVEGEEVATWWVTRPGPLGPRRWLLAVGGTAQGGAVVGDAGRLCLSARAFDESAATPAAVSRALGAGVIVDPRNLLTLTAGP